MHESFLREIADDITSELKPKCECSCAPERKVESLVVMAVVNGEPIVWDAAGRYGLAGASYDESARSVTIPSAG